MTVAPSPMLDNVTQDVDKFQKFGLTPKRGQGGGAPDCGVLCELRVPSTRHAHDSNPWLV